MASLLAVLLTSLGHELGHAVAARLAGLPVRAVVLGPGGGATIRGSSERGYADVLTAAAGPLANLILGITSAWAVTLFPESGYVVNLLGQLAVLQLLTAATNMLPVGQFDGARIFRAWRTVAPVPEPSL
jgi:Zn-dependent protease